MSIVSTGHKILSVGGSGSVEYTEGNEYITIDNENHTIAGYDWTEKNYSRVEYTDRGNHAYNTKLVFTKQYGDKAGSFRLSSDNASERGYTVSEDDLTNIKNISTIETGLSNELTARATADSELDGKIALKQDILTSDNAGTGISIADGKINCTLSSNNTFVAQYGTSTYDEVNNAKNNDKAVFVLFEDRIYTYKTTIFSAGAVEFVFQNIQETLTDGSEDFTIANVTLNSDNEWNNTTKTLSFSNNNIFIATTSTTAAEIKAAKDAGKTIILNYNSMVLTMTGYTLSPTENKFIFTCNYEYENGSTKYLKTYKVTISSVDPVTVAYEDIELGKTNIELFNKQSSKKQTDYASNWYIPSDFKENSGQVLGTLEVNFKLTSIEDLDEDGFVQIGLFNTSGSYMSSCTIRGVLANKVYSVKLPYTDNGAGRPNIIKLIGKNAGVVTYSNIDYIQANLYAIRFNY